jgi:hypothetical protein
LWACERVKVWKKKKILTLSQVKLSKNRFLFVLVSEIVKKKCDLVGYETKYFHTWTKIYVWKFRFHTWAMCESVKNFVRASHFLVGYKTKIRFFSSYFNMSSRFHTFTNSQERIRNAKKCDFIFYFHRWSPVKIFFTLSHAHKLTRTNKKHSNFNFLFLKIE